MTGRRRVHADTARLPRSGERISGIQERRVRFVPTPSTGSGGARFNLGRMVLLGGTRKLEEALGRASSERGVAFTPHKQPPQITVLKHEKLVGALNPKEPWLDMGPIEKALEPTYEELKKLGKLATDTWQMVDVAIGMKAHEQFQLFYYMQKKTTTRLGLRLPEVSAAESLQQEARAIKGHLISAEVGDATPLPYVSLGELSVGHACTATIDDIIAHVNKVEAVPIALEFGPLQPLRQY